MGLINMELNIMLAAKGFFVVVWGKIAVILKRTSLEKLVKMLTATKLKNYHLNNPIASIFECIGFMLFALSVISQTDL